MSLTDRYDLNDLRGLRLEKFDTRELRDVAMPGGKLIPLDFEFYRDHYTLPQLLYFMWEQGLYFLPTWELIDWLEDHIIGSAIEVCAGNGSLGRALEIPATDLMLQRRPDMQAVYKKMNQPIVDYPDDVLEMEAVQAINRFQPDTVIAAYLTHRWEPGLRDGNEHGPKEEYFLPKVKRYIMVGNLSTHREKPLLKKKHEEKYFPWLICRAADQSKNRIFIWKGSKK